MTLEERPPAEQRCPSVAPLCCPRTLGPYISASSRHKTFPTHTGTPSRPPVTFPALSAPGSSEKHKPHHLQVLETHLQLPTALGIKPDPTAHLPVPHKPLPHVVSQTLCSPSPPPQCPPPMFCPKPPDAPLPQQLFELPAGVSSGLRVFAPAVCTAPAQVLVWLETCCNTRVQLGHPRHPSPLCSTGSPL